jgi:hypothetical protein
MEESYSAIPHQPRYVTEQHHAGKAKALREIVL